MIVTTSALILIIILNIIAIILFYKAQEVMGVLSNVCFAILMIIILASMHSELHLNYTSNKILLDNNITIQTK